MNLILRGLHSMINFPMPEVDTYEGNGESDEERGLRLYHVSFYDYLIDKDRSGRTTSTLECRDRVTLLGFDLVAK